MIDMRKIQKVNDIDDIEDYRLIKEVVICDMDGKEVNRVWQKEPTHGQRIELIKMGCRFCQFNNNMVDNDLVYDALDNRFLTINDMNHEIKLEDKE